MKKFLALISIFFVGLSANADFVTNSSSVNMDNIWNTLGKREQKIIDVGARILNRNKIQSRVVFYLNTSPLKSINAYTAYRNKGIYVYPELLNYIENDDELAAVLAHEIAHDIDYYEGWCKSVAMKLNSKYYEYKADEIGIDYMVKAGYNPIAMITIMNKISGEDAYDWKILRSHPKTSKRLMKDYEIIYKTYPQYLSSPMTNNIHYVNWTYTATKDIQKFREEQAKQKI